MEKSRLARPARLERATKWFEATYSIQLSYGRVFTNCSLTAACSGCLLARPFLCFASQAKQSRLFARRHLSQPLTLEQTAHVYSLFLFKHTINKLMAAGVMPEILDACPKFKGLTTVIFSRDSFDRACMLP